MSDERRFEQQSQESEGRPAAEWTTLGISVAFVAAMVALVTWFYFRGAEEVPAIVAEAQLAEVSERNGSWYLPIEILNDGDATVADAIIRGELVTGSGEPQTAEVTIDFLAGGEREQATLVFDSDPREGDLTVAPVSYENP